MQRKVLCENYYEVMPTRLWNAQKTRLNSRIKGLSETNYF